MNRKTNLNKLIKISLFGAIAGILMLIQTPLAIFPTFLQIDISDVPAIIGALVLGPVAGVLIQAVKIGINLILTGTKTVGIGEFANFLIGSSFVIPVGLVFKKRKTFNGAFIGMIFGSISMVFIGAVFNYFVLLPFYAKAYNVDVMYFVEISQNLPIFGKFMKSELDFVIYGVSTFNIFKSIVLVSIVSGIYKFVIPPLIKLSN